MKKISLRIFSLFMATVLIFGIVPISSFATENETGSDVSISDSTSFGKMLNNTISGENADNSDFSITSLEINGKRAKVTFGNSDTCLLVVSVYDEESLQLLGSGVTEINEIAAGSAYVDIEISSMPDYFIAYAFLLDSDYSLLCNKFETKHYTKAFEEFYSKTPKDFDAKRTIIIDDSDKEIDFAVIDSSVKYVNKADGMTMYYDENSLSYVFKNATNEIKSLSVGDKFFYQYGEDDCDFIAIIVKTIQITGNDVAITEDENIGLSDIFCYIKIESDGDYSEAAVDRENLDECYTLLDEGITTQALIDKGGKESYSTSLGIEYTDKSGKISGMLTATISVSTKVYYDVVLFGKDYYTVEVKTEAKLDFSVTVEGKLTAFPDKRIPIPYITVGGIFDFEINITPDISISASGKFNIGVKYTLTVSYDSVNKLNKSQEMEKDIADPDLSGNIEVKLGAKIEFKLALYTPPHAKKLNIKPYVETVSVSVSAAGGVKLTGKTQDITPTHPCKPCISGSIYFYLEIGGNIKLCLIPKKLDFTDSFAKWSKEWYLTDFYLSLQASPKFAMGEGIVCPNKYHKVNVTAVDGNGNPLENVLIFSENCICDADGDGNYNEKEIKTNDKGAATIYLKKGSHQIKAEYDNETKTESVNILEITKTVTFTFGSPTPTTPDPSMQPSSGQTGSVKYKINGDTLTVYGTGDMANYSRFGDAPWYSEKDNIKHIVVESGVNNIGSYTFSQFFNLQTVSIGDTVKSIGKAAFYQCDALQSVNLPASVKTVGDYAFYCCYLMDSLSLGSVETIGAYAFAQCTALTQVSVPATTYKINDSAFAWCKALKNIEIKNKNCEIYNSANTIYTDATISAPTGSKAQTYAKTYSRSFNSLATQGVVDTTKIYDSFLLTYSSCVAGNDYVLLNVTGYGSGFKLSSTNLEFIDQITADSSGVISVNFIPRFFDTGSTTLLIGDFGNGTQAKKMSPTQVSTSVIINNNPGTLSINYKEGVKLTASVASPIDGCSIKWYVNGNFYCDGNTFEYKSFDKDTKITAKLVDVNGNPILKQNKEIFDEETIKVDAGVFRKIVAFFKFTLLKQVVYKTN